MGAKKISAMAAATLPLTGAERLGGVQAGATVGFLVDDILATPFAVQASGVERTLATRFGQDFNVLDFPGATFAAQLQAAHDAAALAGGGRVVIPPGSYAINTSTSGAINITGANIEFVSLARRAATITFSGTGPHIIVGGSTLQAQEIGFRGLCLNAPAGQTLIKTRYARGVRFFGIKAVADNFLTLGDDALDTGHYTYIVELYDGCELTQVGGASCHFVDCRNFVGQWVNIGSYVEGAAAPGCHGFRTAGNIQSRLDDFHNIDGYWSRFDINWDFTDGRLVNAKWLGHHSEGALTDAIRLYVSSSTSKSKINIGCEGVSIIGCHLDALGHEIYIGNNRNEAGQNSQSNITIANNRITGGTANKSTPIVIENLQSAVALISHVSISGITANITPVDASQDLVRLTGGAGAGLADINVSNLNGEGTTTALRSLLRHEGAGNLRTQASLIPSGKNVLFPVSDVPGTVQIARTKLTASLTLFVRTDGSDSNNGLANTSTGAFLTTQAAYDYVCRNFDTAGKTVTLQHADGTYTSGLNATLVPVGGGTVVVNGNSSTPTNVVFSTTSADCFKTSTPLGQMVLKVQNLRVQTTTSGWGVIANAAGAIQISGVDFGACASGHMMAAVQASQVAATGNYTISGAAPVHIEAQYGGQIFHSGRTVTISGTPAFTVFAIAQRMGVMRLDAMTWTGSATGTRYSVTEPSMIYTNGAGATYLPGNASGTATSPGVYV